MMQEYERLYIEFLTKSIKAEKDKVELQIKIDRMNWINGCICNFASILDFRRNIRRVS
jgi:hypothetical protein